VRVLNICAVGLLTSSAFAFRLPPLSAYTKVKNNTFGTWQQETGLSTVWRRHGKLSLESNLAVVWKWPYHTENGTQFTAGFTVRYFVGQKDDTFNPSIYTKTKHDLFHTWAQETGVAGSLWKKGVWGLGFNAGFLYNYPLYIRHSHAGYTLGLTLSRKL